MISVLCSTSLITLRLPSRAPCLLDQLDQLNCVFVLIDAIRFLAGCCKRQLNERWFGFVRFSFGGFLCLSLGVKGLCVSEESCLNVLLYVSSGH